MPPTKPTYKCVICLKFLGSKSALKQHTEIVHRALECCYCKLIFDNYGIKNHLMFYHDDKPCYSCKSCPKGFESYRELLTHSILTHDGKFEHKCNECEKSFVHRSSLSKHKKNIHKFKLYNCSICSKSFILEQKFRNHVSFEHKLSFSCKFCEKSFNQISDLTQHVTNNHPDISKELFYCQYCTLTFKTRYHLDFHINRHFESSIGCVFCGEKATSTEYLLFHIRSKHPECCTNCFYCGLDMNRKEYLYDHMLSQHKFPCEILIETCDPGLENCTKVYKCHICGSSHNSKYSRNLHIKKNHSKNSKCKCTICNLSFGSELTLAEHTDILHANKFKCSFCGMELFHFQNLKLHQILHHHPNYQGQPGLSDGMPYYECKLAKQLLVNSICQN